METAHKSVTLIFSHLPDATQKAFTLLAQQWWLKEDNWYLAGGTALALQCDHRVSVDLDFFTPHLEFDREKIIQRLTAYQWITSLSEKGTLYGELAGAKISFIAYPYFVPQQPFISHNSIDLLHAQDIAVMKVIAISQRGRKRDFIDLYWYSKHREPLIEVLKRVKTQYPNTQHNYHHILKSFAYFEEADQDPDPHIFFDASWEQVKRYFLSIIPSIAEAFLS